MIIHTVAFKTKHPAGSAEETAFLKAGIALGGLPMVRNFQSYKQISPKNNFDFGFAMEFETDQDYEAYNSHPDHVYFVANRWNKEVEDFLEIDYLKYDPADQDG